MVRSKGESVDKITERPRKRAIDAKQRQRAAKGDRDLEACNATMLLGQLLTPEADLTREQAMELVNKKETWTS